MLVQLFDYICASKRVSTQQLSREFHIDFSALEPMLDLLVRKGKIDKTEDQSQCKSSCFKCRKTIVYYQASKPLVG